MRRAVPSWRSPSYSAVAPRRRSACAACSRGSRCGTPPPWNQFPTWGCQALVTALSHAIPSLAQSTLRGLLALGGQKRGPGAQDGPNLQVKPAFVSSIPPPAHRRPRSAL